MNPTTNRPILYTGSDAGYKMFLHNIGLPAKDVKRVRRNEQLYGEKDRLWFIDHGYDYMLKERLPMSYARQHEIKVYAVTPLNLMAFKSLFNIDKS